MLDILAMAAERIASPAALRAKALADSGDAYDTLIQCARGDGGRGSATALAAALKVLEVAGLLDMTALPATVPEADASKGGLRLVMTTESEIAKLLNERRMAERSSR